jgi:Lrp/AsnC family transcriptional regulator for asnA, asnC and gidA
LADDNGRLDEIDTRLIDLLQKDGRTSNSRLAEALGVTEATVRRRIAQLDEAGIMHIVAITDTATRGNEYFFWAWVQVANRPAREVAEEIATIPESVTVSLVSGNYDIFASFSARDKEHMAAVLTGGLGRIAGIQRTDTALALDLILSDVRWARFP